MARETIGTVGGQVSFIRIRLREPPRRWSSSKTTGGEFPVELPGIRHLTLPSATRLPAQFQPKQ
jgi:hypothetical protein